MSSLETVVETINESTGLELDASTVKPETSLDELGVDSLDVYNILVEMEVKTGIGVSDEDSGKFVTLKDLVEFFAAS